MTKGENHYTMLIYGDMFRGNGEIYSETIDGKVHFFKRVEISEEVAEGYVNDPGKLIEEISGPGSKAEWDKESKTV